MFAFSNANHQKVLKIEQLRLFQTRDAEVVKFLWKRKHFEERSWKQKQTWKRLTLYGAGSGSKKYSNSSTSLFQTQHSNRDRTKMKKPFYN